jgi:hypothetical protein
MLVPRIFLSTLLPPLAWVQSTKFFCPESGPLGSKVILGAALARCGAVFPKQKYSYFYQKSEKPLVFY